MASFRKAGILFFVLMVPALSYIIYRFGTTNYYTLPRFIPIIDSTTNEPVMHKVTDQFGERTDTLFRKVPGFKLIDQDGKPETEALRKGKIHVANFFFTRCSTICPKMNTNLSRVQDIFKDRHDLVFISFSVDPVNDRPAELTAYAKKMNALPGKWYFLTGDKAQIYNLGQRGYFLPVVDHGVSYGSPDETFIHSEKLVLVDKEGIIRGFYDGTDKKDIERLTLEIRVLIDGYNKQI